jgi:hypothetical protein
VATLPNFSADQNNHLDRQAAHATHGLGFVTANAPLAAATQAIGPWETVPAHFVAAVSVQVEQPPHRGRAGVSPPKCPMPRHYHSRSYRGHPELANGGQPYVTDDRPHRATACTILSAAPGMTSNPASSAAAASAQCSAACPHAAMSVYLCASRTHRPASSAVGVGPASRRPVARASAADAAPVSKASRATGGGEARQSPPRGCDIGETSDSSLADDSVSVSCDTGDDRSPAHGFSPPRGLLPALAHSGGVHPSHRSRAASCSRRRASAGSATADAATPMPAGTIWAGLPGVAGAAPVKRMKVSPYGEAWHVVSH